MPQRAASFLRSLGGAVAFRAERGGKMRRARRSTKGGYSLSAEREYPPLHPPRERALIGSLNLEELRSLRNQVRCTWLRHEPLRLVTTLNRALLS